MKPALFYALVHGWSPWPGVGRLMAVTSVKGGQLYGRDVEHGNPTHRSIVDAIAYFPTEDVAIAASAEARAAHDVCEVEVKRAQAALRGVQRAQGEAVREAIAQRMVPFEELMAKVPNVQYGSKTWGDMGRPYGD